MTTQRLHFLWLFVLMTLPLALAASCERPSTSPPAATEVTPAVQPTAAEKFIDVGGIKTRYLEAGQGDPLVLVHGGNFGDGVNADRWDLNIGGLAQSFHVFALDKLGQGFTDNPKQDEDYTMAGVVRHTYDFIRAVGLSRIHLIGASRGAYVAARLVLEHPEVIQTLVLTNSGSLAPETGDPNRRYRLVVENSPKDARGAEIYRIKQLSYSTEHVTDETVDLAMRLRQSPKNQRARTKAAALTAQFEQTFERQKEETLRRLKSGNLKVPSLLIWGYNDGSAIIQNGMALFRIIAEGNSKARMYIMNRAGHYNYRELPEEFNQVVVAFILGVAPETTNPQDE